MHPKYPQPFNIPQYTARLIFLLWLDYCFLTLKDAYTLYNGLFLNFTIYLESIYDYRWKLAADFYNSQWSRDTVDLIITLWNITGVFRESQ